MTIEETIARYLDACKARGLRVSTLQTIRRRLHTFFEPVLTEHLAILTADQVNELRARLGRQQGRRSQPLLGSTRELYWRTSRDFLLWCVQQRLLTTNPLEPRLPRHLGEVVRRLRQEAGLSHQDLAEQTELPLGTLRSFESSRASLRREELLRLLHHPEMARLPDEAKAAGIPLGLGNNGVGKA